jgi:hypothetical protein
MIPLVARGIMSLAGRLIARNPRLGKKIFDLLKRPKGITVFRGELAQTMPKAEAAKALYGAGGVFPWKNPELRKQAIGRWFTDEPKYARSFGGRGTYSLLPSNWKNILQFGGGYEKGIIKKIILSQKEAKLARKMVSKIHGHKMPESMYMVPKKALKRAEIDQLQTFIANFKKMIGMRRMKKGGLAQILNV